MTKDARVKLPSVEIIVPNFNNAAYISQCLTSVREQTYANWTCHVVDDGSDDESESIITRYTSEDARIRLTRLEKRSGVSAARNFGIDKCRSDFVIFLDADDLLDRDQIKRLVEVALRSKSDVVRAKHWLFEQEGDKKPNIGDEIWAGPLSGVCLKNAPGMVFYFSSWNTLIRRSILGDKIRFPENVVLGEDRIFNMKMLMAARAITQISDRLYHWRRRKEDPRQATTRLLQSIDEIATSISEWTAAANTLGPDFEDHRQLVHTSAFFEAWWHIWRLRDEIYGAGKKKTFAAIDKMRAAIDHQIVNPDLRQAKSYTEFLDAGYNYVLAQKNTPTRILAPKFMEIANYGEGGAAGDNAQPYEHPLAGFLHKWASVQGGDFVNQLVRDRWYFTHSDEVQAALVQQSDLFDAKFYRKEAGDIGDLDPALHFVRYGAWAMVDPTPDFNIRAYFEEHEELWATGLNPIVHKLLKTKISE